MSVNVKPWSDQTPVAALLDTDLLMVLRPTEILPEDQNPIITVADAKPAFGTALNNLANVVSDDTTTNINNATPTIVPISGIVFSESDDFVKSATGIECFFDGLIRVTATINTVGAESGLNNSVQGRFQVKVGGVEVVSPSAIWINPNNTARVFLSNTTLIVYIAVANGQNIEIQNTRITGTDIIVLDGLNSSQLVVERI